MTVLIPVSQLALRWPEPGSLQLDDWFLFGAMPMGLIKSKCKLSLITNCRENASSQLPLGVDLDYSDKLRTQWALQSSPHLLTQLGYFHWIPQKLRISPSVSFRWSLNALYCVFTTEMDHSITSNLNERDELILLSSIAFVAKGWCTVVYSSVP